MFICREGVHLRGEEVAAQKGKGKPKDMSKKAVLMSGPPGIGKTTSAMIITRYEYTRNLINRRGRATRKAPARGIIPLTE
jgi:Holliday junction resolvasome RuvABC ATP-dependent DNA helicase subunit